MTLASAMATDAAAIVATSDFGQPVRVRDSATSSPRTVQAVVNRMPVDDRQDTAPPVAGFRGPVLHVALRNDATLGIAAADVQPDVTAIEVAYPAGGEARWRPVLRIVRHNAGLVLLEVQS